MTTRTGSATQRLAELSLGLRYDDLPPAVVRRTKELFLDFLGVACGGRLAESGPPLLRAVARLRGSGEGSASVAGERSLYPVHYAALLNGAFAHSQDFDDTHRDGLLHPGAPVFATSLALAEAGHASGSEFLAAAVVGYEVTCRLGRAHSEAVHARGFHPTATTGIFGATAAGARLLGMDSGALLDAWGLALSQAAGSLQFLANGAWNKRVHVGLAAHDAIVALTMAQEGVVGAAEPFTGRFGYYFSYAGGECDLDKALASLGQDFEVRHVAIKPYPCCRYNHAVIDGVVALAQEYHLRPDDIVSIEVELPPAGMPLVAEPEEPKRAPGNVVDAQFSVYFAAAAAVVEGGFTWDSYRLLDDPEVRALAARVRARPAPHHHLGAHVSVRTVGGKRLEKDVPLAKGEPERPVPWEELLAKVRPLIQAVVGEQATGELVSLVERLEEVDDMARVARCLRPA